MSPSLPRSITWRAAGSLLAVVALAATVAVRTFAAGPQAPPAPASTDVLPALLTEVRGLRAAMEQMASAGPRIQLFVARLQLEETRINTMVRRLDGVRDEIASAQREADNSADEQQRIENHLSQQPNDPSRQQFVDMLEHVKREIAQRRANITRLTAEEAQIAQDVAAEQLRWSSINQQLDELEKALAKR
jgi:uncharacterized phage infection (PIP) family protein YhgE